MISHQSQVSSISPLHEHAHLKFTEFLPESHDNPTKAKGSYVIPVYQTINDISQVVVIVLRALWAGQVGRFLFQWDLNLWLLIPGSKSFYRFN